MATNPSKTSDSFAISSANVRAEETYENILSCDSEYALLQGSLFFEGKGLVQESLRRIAQKLEKLNLPYAVCGGMAIFAHGFRRYAEDIVVLVAPPSLRKIHSELIGQGYISAFVRSKGLRDTESKVKIEFLVTGGYPGDGKPKPYAFPDPADVATEIGGIRYVNLPTLINLKLASGISNPQRGKDISDVGEMIKALGLPREIANDLSPYVQEKFLELWQIMHDAARFVRLLPVELVVGKDLNFEALVEKLPQQAAEFHAMQNDGVTIEVEPGRPARLLTHDADVAKKYGFVDESDLW